MSLCTRRRRTKRDNKDSRGLAGRDNYFQIKAFVCSFITLIIYTKVYFKSVGACGQMDFFTKDLGFRSKKEKSELNAPQTRPN